MRVITTLTLGSFAMAVLACGDPFTSVETEPGAGGAGGAMTVSAAATGGGSSNGSGGGAMTCPPNGISHFSDTFDTDELAPEWLVMGDGQAGENGGNGYIALNAEMPLNTYIVSANRYSLIHCEATIEIKQLPNDAGCDATFAVIDANNLDNWAWIGAFGGELFVESYTGGNLVDDTLLALPDNAERWQIRERNGQLAFATSSDGASWTLRGQIPTPQWAGDVRLELHAGGQPESGTREFRFDNLNRQDL